MDDGTEDEFGPGEVTLLPPGHDAWVSGSVPFVAHEFEGATAATYARPAS